VKRDTVKAYRARAKANHDAIDAELSRQADESANRHREAKEKERDDRTTEGTITLHSFDGVSLGDVLIRDQFGWRRVLKVNSCSVTVPSLVKVGWTDTVRFEKIRELKL